MPKFRAQKNHNHKGKSWPSISETVLQKEEYLFLHGLCKRNFKYFQLERLWYIGWPDLPHMWGCPKRVFPPKMAIFGVPKTVLLFQPSVWWRVPRGNLHWTLSWPRVFAFQQIKRVFQTYPNSSGATFHLWTAVHKPRKTLHMSGKPWSHGPNGQGQQQAILSLGFSMPRTPGILRDGSKTPSDIFSYLPSESFTTFTRVPGFKPISRYYIIGICIHIYIHR